MPSSGATAQTCTCRSRSRCARPSSVLSTPLHHLDGHPVLLKHEGIASHGQVLVIEGEGMPVHGVPSEFGKLHVTLAIEMPAALSADERELVGRYFEPPQGITIGRL